MKVAVLTTSYPRFPGDPAGRFVFDAVERLRRRGLEMEVVAPTGFRHYGIAYGAGVVGNLRRNPVRALLAPAMLAGFARAARRAARDADLVDAHWLPVGAVGGLLDLVVHEETGLLVPPRDVAALRRALERLLADPALRRRLGNAGRERVRRHFAWDVIVEKTLTAYEDALSL